jgi:hypothetical protein
MLFNALGAGVGIVDVATSNNGGHPPEFWAQRAADQIMQISESAHPAIREQAVAFKDQLYRAILRNTKNAIASDRSTICVKLNDAGYSQLEALVKGT